MRWFALIGALLFCAPAGARSKHGDVVIDDDGSLLLAGKRLGKAPLPPKPWRVAVKRLSVGGQKVIHLAVRGAGGRAGEVVTRDPATGAAIFAGATGPQGVDGEWSLHLKVGPGGILQYQGVDAAVGCDGQRLYLFPRRYDFKSRRFRPVSARPRAKDAPVLKATRGAAGVPAGVPMNSFKLTFASSQRGDGGSAARLGPPAAANDGDPATAWSEGMGGDGRGEALVARAQDSLYGLKALRIIPGDAKDRRTFRRANRLKSAVLVLSDKLRYRVVFAEDPAADAARFTEPYWIMLPKPAPTRCASLIVDEVYAGQGATGQRGGRTAIAEIAFYTEVEFGQGSDRLLADLASDDARRSKAASAALARMGAGGVKIVSQALAGADASVTRRLAGVLIASPSPAALAPLAALLPGLPAATRRLAMDALERGGQKTVKAVIPLLVAAAGEQSLVVQLAGLLGRLGGDDARGALVGLVGMGRDDTRRAVVQGLYYLRGADDARAVAAAALTAEQPDRRADLVLAAGMMQGAASIGPELAASLVTLWTDAAPFELRYRLLGAMGRLDSDGQLDRILAALALPDPALRWQAAHWLRRSQSPRATAALLAALADTDPPVRAVAALNLRARELSTDGGKALVEALGRERWGLVLGALADALGAHCSRDGVKALREAARRGPRAYAVDRRALESLAQCKPRGLGKFLLAMAGERRWRVGMRSRALALMDRRTSTPLSDELAALLTRLRRGAMRYESDEQVAVAAVGALAVLGGEVAADALADAVALEPIPTIRLAATLALGRVCHASTKKTLRQATRDAPPRVMQAARNSLARCGWLKKKR